MSALPRKRRVNQPDNTGNTEPAPSGNTKEPKTKIPSKDVGRKDVRNQGSNLVSRPDPGVEGRH